MAMANDNDEDDNGKYVPEDDDDDDDPTWTVTGCPKKYFSLTPSWR